MRHLTASAWRQLDRGPLIDTAMARAESGWSAKTGADLC